MTILGIYKRYPFQVPTRVKFFNLFRYIFTLACLEKFLILRLAEGNLKFWRKLIPPLYFYQARSMRTVERGQIKWRLDISRQLDHSIYFYSIKDKAWDNLFKMLRPDFNIIDVGANIGFLSLTFASRCPRGTIYAFEPDSDTFDKLSQNAKLNAFGNIRLFKTALGATRGAANLYKLYVSNPGANRILSKERGGQAPFEQVEINTLDVYEAQGHFDAVDLIKIDVEGFELFVLEGSQNLIRRHKPILFVELVDQNLQLQGCSGGALIQYVKDIGYAIMDAKDMQPLKESENYYTDIICIPLSDRN